MKAASKPLDGCYLSFFGEWNQSDIWRRDSYYGRMMHSETGGRFAPAGHVFVVIQQGMMGEGALQLVTRNRGQAIELANELLRGDYPGRVFVREVVLGKPVPPPHCADKLIFDQEPDFWG